MIKNKKISINILVSIIHFIICYSIFVVLIISNDINTQIIIFIIMIFVKLLYHHFGRCFLGLMEDNIWYPNMSTSFIKTLSPLCSINTRDEEILLINFGLLISINKIFLLHFL